MEPKTIEWRPGPAVCRCCLAEGCYKDISTEYFWMGKREVYAEMLSETLDLSIAYSTSGGPNSNSRLICEQCISKLRDATEFKRQVQECERTFIQWLDPGNSVADATATEVKLEQVKKEKNHNSDEDDDFNDQPDFGDDDGYDDLDDDVPLTKYASKTPKKEPVDLQDLLDNVKPTTKRKSTTTKDKSTAKKAKVSKEKATSSKPKPEKKKKDVSRRNAEVIVKYATAYPFRLPGSSLMCVYCCETFPKPSVFRRHMEDDHKEFNVDTAFAHCLSEGYLKVDCTALRCRVCDQTFETIETLSKHINDHHEGTLDLSHDMGLHPFKFEDDDKAKCALCEKNFPGLRQLSRHMSSHFQNFTCEECGKMFSTKGTLHNHSRFTHISDERICRKCKMTFGSLEEKRKHMETSQKCWPYQCSVCPERFMRWSGKEHHMVNVHGYAKKTYLCKECDTTFPSRNTYAEHFYAEHTDASQICPHCGRKFVNVTALHKHIVVHTKEKLFPCEVCPKSFSRKKNLIQHMWIHSEVKRFCCTVCDKHFNQRVSWKTHMKSYHPEIENYEQMQNSKAQIMLYNVVKTEAEMNN
ncbi:zinc finger protein draculin-like isoform X6 [Aricia agestis]|uniref:zinc finger protein draculin-like isoform X6 n=1 Tax=Aricia agestis TaxID=91739 RepID=UPI001C203891|nr:zinc finger protein draculin-like isoform X6 [Aricia agestis]